MRLLLDTHVMVRMAENELDILPARTRAAVRDSKNDLFVSVVSVWEMSIKHRLGKLPLPCPLAEWPILLDTLGLPIIDLRVEPVLEELSPPARTRDPFDQLLLAICQASEMRLLTIDRALVDHPLAWRPA